METTRGDSVRLKYISKDKDKEKESKIKDKVQSNPQKKAYYASGNNANGSRFLIINLKQEKKKKYKQTKDEYLFLEAVHIAISFFAIL